MMSELDRPPGAAPAAPGGNFAPHFRGRLEIVVRMTDTGERAMQPLFGKPLIAWVVDTLRPRADRYRMTFLCDEELLSSSAAERVLREIEPGCQIVAVPRLMRGLASEMRLVAATIDLGQPLLLASSGHWLNVDIDAFLHDARACGCDGLVMISAGSERKSRAPSAAAGRVVHLDSVHAGRAMGICHFRLAADCVRKLQSSRRAESHDGAPNEVADVYQALMSEGCDIRGFEVLPQLVHDVSTPEDLRNFLQWNLCMAAGNIKPSLEPRRHPD